MELPFSTIQERDLIKLEGTPYFVDSIGPDGEAYLCGVKNGQYKLYECDSDESLKIRRARDDEGADWTGPTTINEFTVVDRQVNQSALYLHR